MKLPCGCERTPNWVWYCEEHNRETRPLPDFLKIADPKPVDNSAARKQVPVATGCYDYFPDALWAVAEISWAGNEKHNPGEPLHDARWKSQDDADCLMRHFRDRGKWDVIVTKDGRELRVRHSAAVAWRALRILQKECEADGAPLARGAQVQTTEETK